ncbi:MAG: DMT family transporter [Bacillota bacterium]
MNERCDESCAAVSLDAAVNAARGVPIPLPAVERAMPAVRRIAWGVVLALGITLLLWASAFTAIRVAVREFDPGALAFFRNSVTALAMLGGALVWQRDAFRRLRRADLLPLIAAGVIGIALYQLSLITGEESVDAGTASLIINTSPIITALLARRLLQEHLGLRGWIGVLLGFAGAALLITGRHGGAHLELGGLFVLVAASAQSLSFIIQKPLLARLGPYIVTTWVGVAGAVSLFAYGPALAADLGHISLKALASGVYLGLFPAAIGNLTWAYALSRLPAGRASAALYLIAPIATLMSWLLLDEQPAAQALLGGAIVIGSVILVNVRVKK